MLYLNYIHVYLFESNMFAAVFVTAMDDMHALHLRNVML